MIMEQNVKNKKINIPIIFLAIVVLIAIGFSVFSKGSAPKIFLSVFKDLSSSFQPGWDFGGCKQLKLDINDPDKYNFFSSLDFTTIKSADTTLLINKDQQKRMFSLGAYELPLETYAVLAIPKLWLYFSSEALSDRDDKLYGLEDSYLSKIILKTGKQFQEINLGKTGEHVFIELDDCPLGNIHPVNRELKIDFEIILEIGCNNFKDGACLDNEGKPLDYINGADLTASIRFFVISGETFTNDMSMPLHFKYE